MRRVSSIVPLAVAAALLVASAPSFAQDEGWVDEPEEVVTDADEDEDLKEDPPPAPATAKPATARPDAGTAAAKTGDAILIPKPQPADKPPADKPPADKPPADKPPADKPQADKPPPADKPAAAPLKAQPAAPAQAAGANTQIAAAATTRTRELNTENELAEHLEARARFLRSGDPNNAEIELGLIIEARQLLGVRNVVVASASLMHEARAARARNDYDRAIKLAETAALLSPDLASAHWMRVRLYFGADWSQLDRIFGAIGDVIDAKLSRFRNTVALLSNILTGIGVALLATILIFTVIQTFKYVRYPAHDLSRILPSFFGPAEAVMLLLIAMASPLVFGFGALCTIVLALFAIHGYQTARERGVSLAAMLILGAMPGILYLAAPLVTFHGSIVDSMETAMSEAFATQAEKELVDFTRSSGRTDLDSALVLAHRYRMRGDVQSAESEYRRALAYQPSNVVARNNLGTLLFLLGREEAAMATFQSATNGSYRAEPLLNLASMKLDHAGFDEAKGLIERARRLDPDLTDRYTRFDASMSTADKLLYADVGQSPLWSRLFEVDEPRRVEVTTELWRTFAGAMPPLAMPIFVLIAVVLAILIARRSDHLNLSTGCPKCGEPAHRSSPAQYCDQCQSIFLKAIAVEPMLRIAKEEDVRSFQRRRRFLERALSIVAGASHVFVGRPIVGVLMIFMLAASLASIRFADGFLVHPWAAGLDPSAATFQVLIAGAFALVLLVISVRSVFR